MDLQVGIKPAKPGTTPTYHIDYVFVPQASVSRMQSVAVGTRAEWIATGLSHHAPVILDSDPNFASDV